MAFVIAHITDTHLSDAKPFFHENFACVAAHLKAKPPDLVINTGDVSLNGADERADLQSAHALHEELGTPWCAVPGNHDVGDNQETATKQPFNAERRARWLDVFGPDFWWRDIPGWRLLGINSLLLGSDVAAAAEQLACVTQAAAGLEGRQLALFLHKPLFHDTPADAVVDGHQVNPGPRAQLMQALGSVTPRLVCTGHLHEHRERGFGDLHQVWAPAVSFTLEDWFLPNHGGAHIVGYIEIALQADGGFTTRLVQPEGLIAHDLADFPDAYGDLRAIKARMDAERAASKDAAE